MTDPLLFEIQFALNRPQHIVRDLPLVTQLYHRRPFGSDDRTPEPVLCRCGILVKRAAVDRARNLPQPILIVPLQVRQERFGHTVVGGLSVEPV